MSETVHWDADGTETAACGVNGTWSSEQPRDVTCRTCRRLAAGALQEPLFQLEAS